MTETPSPNKNTEEPVLSERTRARHRRRMRDKDSYLKDRLSRLRSRAKEKKIHCDLDFEWLCEELRQQGECCAVTGIPFDFDNRTRRTPFSFTFERSEPSGGYTRENTLLVCDMYNNAKNVYTHADVVKMATGLLEKENIMHPVEITPAVGDNAEL